MLKLETIHQEMNNKHVREAAHSLHFDWILDQFDVDEEEAAIKEYLKSALHRSTGCSATEEQLLAAQTLFLIKIETGQDWSQ
jgi:hypothetical protein